MGELIKAVVGEDRGGDVLAHVTPVGAVSGEAEHGEVVGHAFTGNKVGTVRHSHVICCVALFGDFPVADY